MKIPSLLYATEAGDIFDHPHLKMSVRSGIYDFMPYEAELIPLPKGSKIFLIPNTRAVGFDMEKGRFTPLERGFAVGAILPEEYLRLFLPSYQEAAPYLTESSQSEGNKTVQKSLFNEKNLNPAPFLAYAAVGWLEDQFVVTAIKIDLSSEKNVIDIPSPNIWNNHPISLITPEIFTNDEEKLKQTSEGSEEILKNSEDTLKKNVTEDKVFEKSLSEAYERPMEIIGGPVEIIPELIPEKISKHKGFSRKTVVNFSNTKGEPLLSSDYVVKAIKIIKEKYPSLTINITSNCSCEKNLSKIIEAGADSVTADLNSVVEATYNSYYNPKGYNLDEVKNNIKKAKEMGCKIAVQLKTMPGFNDRESEVNAMKEFLTENKVDLILLGDLTLDPNLIKSKINFTENEEVLSIKNMLRIFKKADKDIKFGAFYRTKESFNSDRGVPDLKVPKFKKGG